MRKSLHSLSVDALTAIIDGIRPGDVLGPLRSAALRRELEEIRDALDAADYAKTEPMAAARRGTGMAGSKALQHAVRDLRARKPRMGIRAIARALKSRGATEKIVRQILAPPQRKLHRAVTREMVRLLRKESTARAKPVSPGA